MTNPWTTIKGSIDLKPSSITIDYGREVIAYSFMDGGEVIGYRNGEIFLQVIPDYYIDWSDANNRQYLTENREVPPRAVLAEGFDSRGIASFDEYLDSIPVLPTQNQDWRGSGKRKMKRTR